MKKFIYKVARVTQGKMLATTLLLLMGTASAFAQNQTKGKVIDKYGNPVSGAKVEGVGTSVSTTTELDGSFTLETPIRVKKVKASASGMTSKKARAYTSGTMVKLNKETIWNQESEGFWFANLQVGIPHYNATSFGVMGGYVKKLGFYARGMCSFGKKTDGYWNYEEKSITENYTESLNSITGGVIYNVCAPLYVYAGMGYSYRKMAVESANKQNTWYEVEYDPYYYRKCDPSGCMIDLGAMFRYNKFIVNAGISGYSGQFYINGHVGVGYSF